MIYLSKGIVKENSTEHLLQVARCGQEYSLSGEQAVLWLNGRFGFSEVKTESEKRTLKHLARMGLAETGAENTDVARYRTVSYTHLDVYKRQGMNSISVWSSHYTIRVRRCP